MILAFLFALIAGYPEQPRVTSGPQVDRTIVRVHWQRDVDAVGKACPPERGKTVYACAHWERIGDMTFCDVWAVQPDDFNDEPKLAVLGHELMHCFGAQHERPGE